MAWTFANRLLAKYDAEPGRFQRPNLVVAGVTMGKSGTALIPVYIGLPALR